MIYATAAEQAVTAKVGDSLRPLRIDSVTHVHVHNRVALTEDLVHEVLST